MMKRNFLVRWVELNAWLARCVTKMGKNVTNLWNVKAAKLGIIVLPFLLFATAILFSWSTQSNSFAMNAFLCLLVFDIVALVGDLLTQVYTYGGKPTIASSFGYSRVEVLTHFSILSLGLFLNLWSFKVFITLALFNTANEEIHTGRFIPSVIVGSAAHFAVCSCNNKLNRLSQIFCTTTTLQRFAYRIINSFGVSIPSVSTSLLTPFTTLGVFAGMTIIILNFALQSGARWVDFTGGIFILMAIFDAIWPLFKHTAQILLQTIPPHISTQLEKTLREALTIDGVLEFRNEFFWTVTYGHIAGTLHVRIRRDASEQLVLVKLHHKLQSLVPHLTIQVTKDDFSRNFGVLQILCDIPRPVHIMNPSRSPSTDLTNLSPISRPDGSLALNRMLYSTSSSVAARDQQVNSNTINNSPSSISNSTIGNSFSMVDSPHSTSSSLHNTINNESPLGLNSDTFLNNTPRGATSNIVSSGSNIMSSSVHSSQHYKHPAVYHSRSASLDDALSRPNNNPFTIGKNSSSLSGNQTNILINSANKIFAEN